jgi:hypothetical protein
VEVESVNTSTNPSLPFTTSPKSVTRVGANQSVASLPVYVPEAVVRTEIWTVGGEIRRFVTFAKYQGTDAVFSA